jgi:hypothetical protein
VKVVLVASAGDHGRDKTTAMLGVDQNIHGFLFYFLFAIKNVLRVFLKFKNLFKTKKEKMIARQKKLATTKRGIGVRAYKLYDVR